MNATATNRVYKIRDELSGKYFSKPFFRDLSLSLNGGDICTSKANANNRLEELTKKYSVRMTKRRMISDPPSHEVYFKWKIIEFDLVEIPS